MKPRILIHSNGPHTSTGYGVQTALLAERLKADGYEVAISCTWGHAGSMSEWHGIPIYPQGYLVNSDDMITAHANHWFGGDPKAGWIIPLQDVWTIKNPEVKDYQVAAWCPVDHLPAPPEVLQFFHRTGATPIAMSRFGERCLSEAGLDPVFIPLAVNTTVFKPTPTIEAKGRTVTGRDLLDIPADAFVVGMVAMNKGWARDRKGFNEAFRAFAGFWQRHQNAVLYLHCDLSGAAEGINLLELAVHAGVPEHAIRHVNQYAYRIGLPADMMAAVYTAMDVLMSPSHGEGFCVPLIEAQACGTPVIASDFSSQTELAGPQYGAAGWLVKGQLEWDPAQHASYLCPYTIDVERCLEEVFAVDRSQLADQARLFAEQYDADAIYRGFWEPFLATLEPPAPIEREPMTDVRVICAAMRPANIQRLVHSFEKTNDGTASLTIVCDDDNHDLIDEVTTLYPTGLAVVPGPSTYAEKVNAAYRDCTESFVLPVGDDVEFHHGWISHARGVSTHADVIGTNDSQKGRVRNQDVADGRHADHFFVRRAYIETEGTSLDGPSVLLPETYKHWYVDKEVVELAKARGVFTPCLESIVEHHHPGYDGAPRDDVYKKAIAWSDQDAATFRDRLPLIGMQRTHRGMP